MQQQPHDVCPIDGANLQESIEILRWMREQLTLAMPLIEGKTEQSTAEQAQTPKALMLQAEQQPISEKLCCEAGVMLDKDYVQQVPEELCCLPNVVAEGNNARMSNTEQQRVPAKLCYDPGAATAQSKQQHGPDVCCSPSYLQQRPSTPPPRTNRTAQLLQGKHEIAAALDANNSSAKKGVGMYNWSPNVLSSVASPESTDKHAQARVQHQHPEGGSQYVQELALQVFSEQDPKWCKAKNKWEPSKTLEINAINELEAHYELDQAAMLREVRTLEVTLAEEHQRQRDNETRFNAKLDAQKEAHTQDIKELEKMVMQVLGENKRLAGMVAAWEDKERATSSSRSGTPMTISSSCSASSYRSRIKAVESGSDTSGLPLTPELSERNVDSAPDSDDGNCVSD